MEIQFIKYHGTGNDFIMIDDRNETFPIDDHKFIESLCHRRFGIGADGLILIQKHSEYDFSMKYFNSDGYEGSMCGNGGRCTVHFARELGIFSTNTYFMAIDGLHKAHIKEDYVSLAMNDVIAIDKINDYFFLDTGSPHVVIFTKNIEELNVFEEGQKIRYNTNLFPKGTNVNFIQEIEKGLLKIRTYERGVEDETWSCGTGSVASAIIYSFVNNNSDKKNNILLESRGGNLEVSFEKRGDIYTNILLKGSANKVFEGTLKIN